MKKKDYSTIEYITKNNMIYDDDDYCQDCAYLEDDIECSKKIRKKARKDHDCEYWEIYIDPNIGIDLPHEKTLDWGNK